MDSPYRKPYHQFLFVVPSPPPTPPSPTSVTQIKTPLVPLCGEVILGLGALSGLKKFRILIEFELWRRGRKMGLWGLRRGEPVRKVEGGFEVEMMEDRGRREEREMVFCVRLC